MKEKTAMQELIYNVENGINLPSNWKQKALQKERDMIEGAYNEAIKNESTGDAYFVKTAQQYYNEKFEQLN